jgi:tellurite resistance protein
MLQIKTLEDLLNTPQKKLGFFQNLVLVAAADGNLDEQEGQFLLQIGNRLGLTFEQVQPIVDNLGILSFIAPDDGLQRTMELQTLVQMMLQDGEIDPREYAMCVEYATRVGYSKQLLDDMIQQLAGDTPESGTNALLVS